MDSNYSVLMSVYRKENSLYLSQAVNSMLDQSVKPSEFVIVCDGELTDELNNVIDEFLNKMPDLFKVVRLKQNVGLGLALNEGLKECTNELVARMDSDDIALPDRMEKQLLAAQKYKDATVIGGQIAEFVDSTENIVGYRNVPLDFEEIKERLKFKNPMNHVTTVFKRSEIIASGSYSDYIGFEDYQLWAKLIASGKMLVNIDSVCCYVRVGQDMYKRRGGMEYFKNTKRMERYLLQKSIIGKFEYTRNVVLRFVGTVLMPNSLRGFLFGKLMRKSADK